jgi:prepilin-type N-terminal cleavage/methylation domain-containing protein
MNYEPRTTNSNGFSLTEVLLAVGILAVGMLFIAGTFLVGIHFSTIATEQTIAAVASDEAFAKIKLYGVNLGGLSTNQQTLFETVALNPIDPNEFAYPSTRDVAEKQYYWSALCRRVAPDPNRLVQVTVFVSRKAGAGTKYRNPADPFNLNASLFYPVPVKVGVLVVLGIGNEKKLKINEAGKEIFVNDGYTIVGDQTGQIYRVVNRRGPPDESVIELDRNWAGPLAPSVVWVIPPPFGGGRHPCIAVYQTEMRF